MRLLLAQIAKRGERVESKQQTVIPVLEERASITARPVVTDRVIIRTEVETREETIERLLRDDEVVVERVPIGREVETAPETREQDGVLIVPVVEEELVLRTRLILKEEVHVRVLQKTRPVSREVRLRREVVSAEHAAPEPLTQENKSNGNNQ